MIASCPCIRLEWLHLSWSVKLSQSLSSFKLQLKISPFPCLLFLTLPAVSRLPQVNVHVCVCVCVLCVCVCCVVCVLWVWVWVCACIYLHAYMCVSILGLFLVCFVLTWVQNVLWFLNASMAHLKKGSLRPLRYYSSLKRTDRPTDRGPQWKRQITGDSTHLPRVQWSWREPALACRQSAPPQRTHPVQTEQGL